MLTQRRIFFLTVLFTIASLAAKAQSSALSSQRLDSVATAAQISSLEQQRTQLQTRIKQEDAKRGTKTDGVTPQTQEALNDRQDSLCLSLRSQLVDVELQLSELQTPASASTPVASSGSNTQSNWAQQVSTIVQSHQQNQQSATKEE